MNKKINIVFNLDTMIQIYYIPQCQSGIYYVSKFILQEFLKNKDLFNIYGTTENFEIKRDLFKKVPELNYLKKVKIIKNQKTSNRIIKFRSKIKNTNNFFKKIFYKFKLFLYEKKNKLKNIDHYFSFYWGIPDYIANDKNIKKYLICHDISPIRHPEWYCTSKNEEAIIVDGFKNMYNNLNEDFTIFTVSTHTKNDFIDYFKDFDKNKVIETTISIDKSKFFPVKNKELIDKIKSKYKINKDDIYFLTISALHPRKNQKFLLESFLMFLDKNENNKDIQKIKLVITGSKLGVDMEQMTNTMIKYKDNIVITGFVTDDDINYIMNGALAFVYVSFFEGFGMPILEAICAGVPVISSNTTSMPQAYGNAAIGVDPKNYDELIEAFEKMYFNENLREELIKKGFEQSKKFGWDRCVNIMKKIIINDNNK